MPYRPRLRRHLDAHVAAPNLVIVQGEGVVHRFHNRLLPLLTPHLDGQHTPEELVDILARETAEALPKGGVSLLDVIYGLQLLAEKDCLTDLEDDELAAVHDTLGVDAAARQRLQETAVRIQTLDDSEKLLVESLVEALRSLGVRVDANTAQKGAAQKGAAQKGAAREGAAEEDATVRIVVTQDYLHPELDAINRVALDAGAPWMLLRPTGSVPWVGPILRPGSTACWTCLATRLRLNRPYRELLGKPPIPTPAVARELTWQTTALRIFHWVTSTAPEQLEGSLWTFDARTLETQQHQLTRLPGCPACGQPTQVDEDEADPEEATAITLQSVPLEHRIDGGYRARAPEVTFERLRRHLSPLTGLVHDLRPIPTAGSGTDNGLHVYLAEHPFPHPQRGPALRTGQRAQAAGKGMTAVQARTGAVCEALERYSGLHHGDEPRRRARLGDFAPGDALLPSQLLLISETQYAGRDPWNAQLDRPGTPSLARRALWLPAEFDSDAEVDWTPLWSLRDEITRWIPTACCYFHAPARHEEADSPTSSRFAAADSNGCAAGTCLEEAILQGFLELVERDAVALWWYNRVRRPGLDLERLATDANASRAGRTTPRLRQTLEHSLTLHHRLGRRLEVLDLTHDFDLPTYAAISRPADTASNQATGPVFGFGCHLNAGLALARSLTELGQSLPALHAPTGDKSVRRVLSGELTQSEFLEPLEYVDLRGDAFSEDRTLGGGPGDLGSAVTLCVDRAAQLGLDTLVLDQSREEVGLAVVRVVIPGMRHFRPRLAPGRLYDVPVALGWLPSPTREADTTPVHLLT